MSTSHRRQMIRDYKEQTPQVGVFALRCAATGGVWAGISRNLAQQPNGIAFSLRMGASGRLNPELMAAAAQHGADAIAFEVVEVIDTENLGAYGVDSQLKDRLAHWLETLSARKVFG